MTTWFTADTHFNHTNIIKYCNRPFKGVNEMNSVLVETWNSVVSPTDEVWHLGDFGFAPVKDIFLSLKGRKHLVVGSHDDARVTRLPWDSVERLVELPKAKYGASITLCHYAMKVWPRSHYGALHLFGHSHGNLPGEENSMDVGVDVYGFAPISLEEVKEALKWVATTK